jgi:capsular polysaccharide transport system ATP-binding protein
MIKLEGVCKAYRTHHQRKVVLQDVSASFEVGFNIGILGVNGAGKSTLLRIMAGNELPDSGRVTRKCRVSFPLGFSGTIHPNLSGRQNVAFVARVYGVDPADAVEFVDSFAELGNYYDMPTRTYSSGMKAKLSFGLSLAIDFDIYLIDEVIAVGDARFQARCRAAFEERIRHASIIMVSHSFDSLRAYCDAGAVLDDGELTIYPRLDDAIDQYRRMIGVDQYAPTAS